MSDTPSERPAEEVESVPTTSPDGKWRLVDGTWQEIDQSPQSDPQKAQGVTGSRKLALASLALIAIAGIAAGVFVSQKSGRTLQGTVSARAVDWKKNGECTEDGRLTSVGGSIVRETVGLAGTRMTLIDNSGKTLGTYTLASKGELSGDWASGFSCNYEFSFTNVPDDALQYTLTDDDGRSIGFTRDELDQQGWSVAVTLS